MRQRRSGTLPENKEHCTQQTNPGTEIVPGQFFPHIKNRKGDKYCQRNDFLQDLQLGQIEHGVADTVGRDLQQIFKEGDPPPHHGGNVPGFGGEIFQVSVPGERHENIGEDQQTDGLHGGRQMHDHSISARAARDIRLRIYDKNDTEHVGWFWQPYEAGKPIWMKPYYNKNNNILMISYVIPMYYEEQFIGVVGMDFDYKVLSERVQKIEVYENGFAYLSIDGAPVSDINNETDNAEEYLSVSGNLVNGMTLVLSASYDDIRQIRYEITVEILFAVLIISVLFTVLATLIVKKIVHPLKKLTEASAKLSNGDYDVDIVSSNMSEIKLLSMSFQKMTKRLREREERLHLSANRDSLTGLRNTTSYKFWEDKIDKAIESDTVDFGLAVFDINDLKKTNDKYGHGAGNEVIIAASAIISGSFKHSPVFRIGGDEFLVILENEDLENYETLLENMEIKSAGTIIEDKIPVTIAGGFARFDAQKDTCVADVFKRADENMYENKRKTKATTV